MSRIDCYLDIASFYSYVVFADLLSILDKLAANGVEVEFHPVFLGGIMQRSGNRPPWVVKAKAKYLSWDTARAARAVGIANWGTPNNLFELAKTLSPLRALHYIKAKYPTPTFHAALMALFRKFWEPPHAHLFDDAVLEDALATATSSLSPSGDGGSDRLFSADEVRRIMDARDSFKNVLQAETDRALELGAFGAPWLWVTNAQGVAEPFFGSDRFGEIYKHLGIAFQDLKVLTPAPKL
ncbi:hypothetical protein HIM_07648 [Hirsutella minnesotensis 3608]|uniref:DSBA-like thioredoxin domain-containing protein n=1 Tax=Hirsutella minnesotensis 3608 TaxID=1043627 RepID=A0A0F7ZN00_9HYPO|nr:hypothetical protein HIM_07648 [Hirsutella minnesotensis 3608]